MARVTAVTYTRLRRLPGDQRLYITTGGSTDAGYLAEAAIQYTSGQTPVIHLELEEHPHELYGDGIDAARYDISVDRILLHDVHQIAPTVQPSEHGFHQLMRVLDQVRPMLSDAVPPECGHEDVIETPELGNPDTPGICMWCPAPLVRRHGTDSWVPA